MFRYHRASMCGAILTFVPAPIEKVGSSSKAETCATAMPLGAPPIFSRRAKSLSTDGFCKSRLEALFRGADISAGLAALGRACAESIAATAW